MASIDQETEQYYNKYFDLFNNPGWKQLIEELQQNALVINSVEATKDQNDLYVRKGQLNVLAYILNFETTTNNNYDELTADDQSI
jgi:3-methyladenine DNA glycosylase AlkC